jgi:hypothetical protein
MGYNPHLLSTKIYQKNINFKPLVTENRGEIAGFNYYRDLVRLREFKKQAKRDQKASNYLLQTRFFF